MKSVLSLDETPSALERSISAASKLNLFIYLILVSCHGNQKC